MGNKKMSADRPSENGRQYHLQTRRGDIAPHCLLVGAPERATQIAKKYFRGARLVGDHRGLVSYTGTFEDVEMSVVTTGMGGPSIGIVLPEAVNSGARSFIRVGSCSALFRQARLGDLAIATGAVRLDGASANWAPEGYPAVADYRVTMALTMAAEQLGFRHHVGIGATTDCFYEGQARPGIRRTIPRRLADQHRELVQIGVFIYEMENAPLFVWSSTHGIPAGSVTAMYGNRATNRLSPGAGEQSAIETALYAMLRLPDR